MITLCNLIVWISTLHVLLKGNYTSSNSDDFHDHNPPLRLQKFCFEKCNCMYSECLLKSLPALFWLQGIFALPFFPPLLSHISIYIWCVFFPCWSFFDCVLLLTGFYHGCIQGGCGTCSVVMFSCRTAFYLIFSFQQIHVPVDGEKTLQLPKQDLPPGTCFEQLFILRLFGDWWLQITVPQHLKVKQRSKVAPLECRDNRRNTEVPKSLRIDEE